MRRVQYWVQTSLEDQLLEEKRRDHENDPTSWALESPNLLIPTLIIQII